MNRTIWKTTLSVTDRQTLQLPRGAALLTVQMQFDMPQMWALVDPSQPIERRVIRIAGTGHPVDFNCPYIGTFQLDGGALVFHVFDGGPEA